jgi:hypothetical protein
VTGLAPTFAEAYRRAYANVSAVLPTVLDLSELLVGTFSYRQGTRLRP